MLSLIILFVLSISGMYYFFKLRKLDKSKSDVIASIIIFSPVINNLSINRKVKDIILIFMFFIAVVLYKICINNIERKNLHIVEKTKNNLEE